MGMASNERLEHYLHKFTPAETFAEMKIPLSIVATDLMTGKSEHFTEGEIGPALRASCAYPGLFLPVEYRGQILVDGFLTETVPAEAAREIGRWLVRTGKDQEALAPYADAFTIPDNRNTDTDRAKDRAQLGDIYRQIYGSEKGLGDVLLEAYDRTTGLLAARSLRLRGNDPNAQAGNVLEFTISGVDGAKLPIASLRGKAVVFDFWATWCGPCRAQHPLYEEVKQRFRDSPDVVFLSIATDDERDLVAPFLKDNNWPPQRVYFEDGLSRVLAITSIPTTIVLDRRGEVISRMNGFVPGRFVDMLTDRIRDALKN